MSNYVLSCLYFTMKTVLGAKLESVEEGFIPLYWSFLLKSYTFSFTIKDG